MGLNIQRDAPLIRIIGEEKKALLLILLAMIKGTDVSSQIAFRGLNLDNVGTQVRQDFTTKIALLIGQIQDSIRTQW
jgi:hypothetical protein